MRIHCSFQVHTCPPHPLGARKKLTPLSIFFLAFQVAVALAEAQGQKDGKGLVLIKKEHLKATVDMSKEFSDYLKRVHRQDMSKKAAVMGIRNDAYDSGSGSSRNLVTK